MPDGIGLRVDPPPDPPDAPRQVHVLGHRVGRVAARLQDRLAPPRADSARHHGHGVDERVRAPVEILAGDVFDGLPVRERVHAIADLHVAGHRADVRVAEVAHQALDGVLGEDGVGVEGDDDLAARVLDTDVECRGLAGVLLHQQPDAVAEAAHHFARSAVLRAVVDHDDLEVGVAGREHRLDRPHDHLLFVVRRNHDAHRWPVGIVEMLV